MIVCLVETSHLQKCKGFQTQKSIGRLVRTCSTACRCSSSKDFFRSCVMVTSFTTALQVANNKKDDRTNLDRSESLLWAPFSSVRGHGASCRSLTMRRGPRNARKHSRHWRNRSTFVVMAGEKPFHQLTRIRVSCATSAAVVSSATRRSS